MNKYGIQRGGVVMGLLTWIGGVVVVFWLLGLVFQIGGGLIHTLLVIAGIIFVIDFLSKKTKL